MSLFSADIIIIHMQLINVAICFLHAGTPTGVTARRIGYNTVNVSWMPPLKGSTMASYEVFYQFIGATKNVNGGNTSNTELTHNDWTDIRIFVKGSGAKGKPVLPCE